MRRSNWREQRTRLRDLSRLRIKLVQILPRETPTIAHFFGHISIRFDPPRILRLPLS